jgi:hypothetical protein
MSDLPIACSLTPEALRARREGLLTELARQAEHSERLPEGLRFRFPASTETVTTIARAIDAERRCCRFLQFTVTVAPDEGPISLELTGPPGAGEFVAALIDI